MLLSAFLLTTFLIILLGYPVALSLCASALLFVLIGYQLHHFDLTFLITIPERLFGILSNETLIAIPLFIVMGTSLEKSGVSESLLEELSYRLRNMKGGLAFAILLVSTLLAASTGIVGATVVTLGLLAMPGLLKQNYDAKFATGLICSAGTLGQIIPPSIVLIILADVISNSYQQAQLAQGIFAPETVSVSDLFLGALLPGFLLVGLYALYIRIKLINNPVDSNHLKLRSHSQSPSLKTSIILLAPLFLIILVLGSILFGYATPTEASAIGASGALLLTALNKKINTQILNRILMTSSQITAMVFFILIGASLFSLVFRGLGGDEVIQSFFNSFMGDKWMALGIVMIAIFLLGFILDFIEITYIVIPIVAPVILQMGVDPVWFAVLIALNLQTSFLTPPFGFSLFYLRGVLPQQIPTTTLYKGVIPFILIQLILIMCVMIWPGLILQESF